MALDWQLFAGSPSPRSPIPARGRDGRHAPFKGEEVGVIVSSPIPIEDRADSEALSSARGLTSDDFAYHPLTMKMPLNW